MQQLADGIGNPSLDSNPGSLRVIQSRYLEGLLPLRVIEGHKKSSFFSIIEGHSKRGVIQEHSIIHCHNYRLSMYKRLYGTREGRNVVLNPVPSHLRHSYCAILI